MIQSLAALAIALLIASVVLIPLVIAGVIGGRLAGQYVLHRRARKLYADPGSAVCYAASSKEWPGFRDAWLAAMPGNPVEFKDPAMPALLYWHVKGFVQ